MGGALGDADGGGYVSKPDAGIARDADQDMRVVGQEVPAGSVVLRALVYHDTGKVFHEFMVLCSYVRRNHLDSSSLTDAGRNTDPAGFANPAPVRRAGGIPATGGMK
jgi:hypothetical protein